MTPTPRKRSFSKTGYWLGLLFITSFLLLFSPLGFFPQHASQTVPWIAHLAFPLVLASFGWLGPVWGLGAVAWLAGVIGLLGLVLRDPSVALLPLGLSVFAFVVHRGIGGWQTVLQENRLRVSRAAEEINTRRERIRHLQEMETAGSERLQRYRGLRGFVNRLNLNLPPDDLMNALAASVGDQVPGAERVLLYLVNPEGLHLELKRVWRRTGSEMIKAKRGDAYDHWVLRQGQPLLVEEVGRDFRFPEVTPAVEGRPLGSLLVVPLRSEHRSLGVLRVEALGPREVGPDELRLMGIVADLASLAAEKSTLYGRMAQLANTDDLTGLAVKGFFQKQLEETLLRVSGNGPEFSVLLVDIDHFKGYNDSFGHSAGDKLLRQMGQLLSRLMGPTDLAARFGGEEFVCLVPGGKEAGAQRAEEVRARAEAAPVELRRALARVTVSVGVAFFPADGREASLLLRVADRRLYRAKAEGRNQVCSTG